LNKPKPTVCAHFENVEVGETIKTLVSSYAKMFDAEPVTEFACCGVTADILVTDSVEMTEKAVTETNAAVLLFYFESAADESHVDLATRFPKRIKLVRHVSRVQQFHVSITIPLIRAIAGARVVKERRGTELESITGNL